MKEKNQKLDFSIKQIGSHFAYTTIIIPKSYVEKIYSQASFAQQSEVHTHGFSRGATPLSYIEQNYKPHLLEHIKEFCFKYFVISWLYKKILKNKLLIAGAPRLKEITIDAEKNIHYNFSLTLANQIGLQGWKRIPFKAPKRKNYKDLDRQVKNFLKEELNNEKQALEESIQIGDWVYFSISLLGHNNIELFKGEDENLWLKIGFEEADESLQKLFIGKKINDVFITNNDSLQSYFSSNIETQYNFKITILDFTPHTHFEIEQFKKYFRIRNSQELHQKMIEVFSYRNDISQRRSTAEETLKLLLNKHSFDVPNHLVLRQQKEILDAIHQNPDYQVYKMETDFHEKIKKLAIKQVKEVILTQQLAYHENIAISTQDIKGYLNLTKRNRTKEFIYFEPPTTKFLGQEAPISSALLEQSCLREKILNHAIYYLTKQRTRTT